MDRDQNWTKLKRKLSLNESGNTSCEMLYIVYVEIYMRG